MIFFCNKNFLIKIHFKRVKLTAKSPVFSHVNATLSGLSTIRSSGSNIIELLQKQFDHLQDVHTGVWYIILVVPVAFGLFIDFVTCMFIACVCFSFISIETGIFYFQTYLMHIHFFFNVFSKW